MAQVSYGTITITDTNDIESIIVEYARNQNPSSAPESGWSTNRPAWAQGYYIWQRTRIHKSGTDESSDTYGTAVCLTGSTGQTGLTGRGISSIVTTYCNYGTGTPAASYSGWQSTVPAYDSTKPNYWVKTVITYTTGSPATDTSIYKDNGITDAVSTSAEANATASEAWDKADEAQDDAQEALDLARNTNYAWWSLATEKTVGQNTFAAGSYGTFIRSEDFQNNPTNQPNIFVDANGLYLRRALTNLASFTGTALTFNNPSTGSAQLVIGANGTLQSGNYQRGSDTKFSTNGTKIDLINGDIITKYFRLSQGLENLNAGAYIHGTIEALDGKIGAGSSNYWEIGQYTDYNNTTNATMVGHGGSFIQLGDSSTWRLATNRIHTGWYATGDTVLHYPQDENNKYWDFGIHVPYSDSPAGRGSDKFIYIRTQNAANNSLQNLLYDLDDNYSTQQWEYKFWIDSNGNVHAPGFYVGNSTTPIGGGANTIAQKIINSDGITFGKGSTTKPIYIDNNGYVQEIGYTIQTSVPSGAVFTDHITTATTTGSGNAVTSITADANGALTVTKGTTFSTTDKNVQSTEANTTKIWLVGTPTSGTRTGTLNYDSGVYITTTAGVLHATTFEGNLSGTASRATADSDGNTIKTTYLKLTGGNVTGAVTFGDSVSADELTAGDLIVNGSASFTNNLQVNTINGVAVGNSPKFTDNNTTYTFANGTNGFTVTPSGGTAQTVTVTPSITNNVTGSGTSGSLAKWNGTNTLTNGPVFTSGGTGYLKQDGTWGTPGGTYSLPIAIYNVLGGIKPLYNWTNAIAETSAASITSAAPTINSRQTTTGRYYAIEIDANGRLFVNVPWTNVNNSYLTSVSWGDIGSKPTTLSGYGITDAKIANGVITLGNNTITPLVSFTETDPIFSASAAADITSSDITNWNGKTSNVGTVRQITAGTGLKIGTNTSGGNITDTGTINHINSVTAKTAASQVAKTLTWGDTFTIYEEKYDGQGHITGVASYNMTMPSNPDTHYTANLKVGSSATATSNSARTTSQNSIFLNLIENSEVRDSHNIVGAGTVTVSSDANGKITITGSNHPTSLKNPNAITLNLFNETAERAAASQGTPTSTISYDGSIANQSFSAAGTNAITSISASAESGGATTFTLIRANGAKSTFNVTVTASIATGATTLRDSDGPISTTGSTTPVFFEDGVPKDVTGIAYSLLPTGTGNNQVAIGNHTHAITLAADTGTTGVVGLSHGGKYKLTAGGQSVIFTLPSDNNTDTKVKLTSQSTSGTYPLMFGPTSISSGTAYEVFYNTGINVNPNTSTITATNFNGNASTATTASKLGTVDKGSSTKPIYLVAGVATECSTYAGGTAVTLNGTSKAASTASFYAPTGAGTEGYVLAANSSGIPTWIPQSDISSGNTYTTTIATETTAASQLTLAHGTRYKITAGGTDFVFTMPASGNTNYYHKTGNWSGLTYTAAKVGSPDDLAFTIPTGTTSTTVLRGDHVYTAKIEEDTTSTNQISLAYGTKYKLTAGGSTYVFTMPASDNTNTWRIVQVNGTDILGSGTNTNKLNLKAGDNVTISNSSGTVTIASSYTNTDTKVTQAYSTNNDNYPLLMTTTAGISSTDSRGDTTAILVNKIYGNPSTGNLVATKFNGYTLAAACAKGVDTSIGANSTSTNLPTSQAVASFVEGKGYLTSHQTYNSFTGKPTANATPGFGGTVTISQISQSTTGQVSGTDRTITIPSTIATNSVIGLVKPWYSHTVASTGPTTGSNSTAVAVNAISTTSGKYYAIESDSNGRLFVNVPWTDNNTDVNVTQTKWVDATTIYDVLLSASATDAATATTTAVKTSRLKFDPTNSKLTLGIHANMAYDSVLDALVFSFV